MAEAAGAPFPALAALADSSLRMDGGAADRLVVSPMDEPEGRRDTVVTEPLVSSVTTLPFFSSVAATFRDDAVFINADLPPVDFLVDADPLRLDSSSGFSAFFFFSFSSSSSARGRVDIRRRPGGTETDGSSLTSLTSSVGTTAAAGMEAAAGPFLRAAVLLVGTRVGQLGIGSAAGTADGGGGPRWTGGGGGGGGALRFFLMLGHLGGATGFRTEEEEVAVVVEERRRVLRFLLTVVVVLRLLSLVGLS